MQQQFSEKEDWGIFDDLDKLGVHVEPKIKLSENMIRFLFYQGLEEIENLTKNHFNSLDKSKVENLNIELFDKKEDLKTLNQMNVNAYQNEIKELISKNFEDLTAEQKTQRDLQEQEEKQITEDKKEKTEEKIEQQLRKKSIFSKIFGF